MVVEQLSIDNLLNILRWSNESHGSKWVYRCVGGGSSDRGDSVANKIIPPCFFSFFISNFIYNLFEPSHALLKIAMGKFKR